MGEVHSKGFSTEPHEFIAEGDKVVVLTTAHVDGETIEAADILTNNSDVKPIAFDTLGDPSVFNRVFAK